MKNDYLKHMYFFETIVFSFVFCYNNYEVFDMKKKFYLIISLMTILFLVVGCSQNLLPNNSSTVNEKYE